MKRGVLLVLAPAIVVVLVVVALVLRPGARALKSGEAEVQVAGRALVTHADGTQQSVTSSVRIHAGDAVEVRSGTAKIKTNNAVYTARAGTNGAANTQIAMAGEPSLLAGELLASSSKGATVRSSGGSVTVGANGSDSVARLTRTLALGLSVYRGSATLESAGNELTVDAFRAAEVASIGQVPRSASPLRYRATDKWDRTYLSTAITIDQELDPLARAFDQSSPAAITPASLHVPDLPASSEVASLIARARKVDGALTSPSDAIVGASLASLGNRGSFASRWDDVFGFHAAGASWGLVAMDQGVTADPLVTKVRQAVDRTPISIGTPTQAASEPSQPTIAGPAPGSGAASTTTPPSGSDAGTSNGGGTPSGGGSGATGTPSSTPTPTTRPPLLGLPSVTLPPVTVPPVVLPNSPNPVQGVIDAATNVLSGLLNTVSGPNGILH